MRRIVGAVVAALLLASVAGPVSAVKPATSGFLPAGHGYSATDLATENLVWSAAPMFEQSPWVTETCGPNPGDRDVWFLGGPPNEPPTGSVTCRMPKGMQLVVEAADLIVSTDWGDGSNPAQLRASLNSIWPNLVTVEVTFDGQAVNDPDDYVATTVPVTMPANDWLFSAPNVTMARYYQFVTGPLSQGTHTITVHYEWTPDWFGTHDRDYTIVVE
jgi:hypothetical protein